MIVSSPSDWPKQETVSPADTKSNPQQSSIRLTQVVAVHKSASVTVTQ